MKIDFEVGEEKRHTISYRYGEFFGFKKVIVDGKRLNYSNRDAWNSIWALFSRYPTSHLSNASATPTDIYIGNIDDLHHVKIERKTEFRKFKISYLIYDNNKLIDTRETRLGFLCAYFLPVSIVLLFVFFNFLPTK